MNESVRPNYGYEKIRDEKGVTYSVQGVSQSGCVSNILFIFLWLCFSIFIVGAGVGFISYKIFGSENDSLSFGILILTMGVMIFFGIRLLIKINSKIPQKVCVTKNLITVDLNKKYAYDISHISEIIIGNPANSQTYIHSKTVSGIANNMLAAETTQRSWFIRIRYGAESFNIFSCLSKGVAEALFEDFVKTVDEFR